MSCFDNDIEEPLWALSFKDYDLAELNNLISYVNSARSWFEQNNLHTSTEDIVGFRVGMPIAQPTEVLETTALYTATGDLDQLVKSISLDTFKISAKVSVNGAIYSQPYTFKSAFQHAIFTNYFVDGIENLTGFSYLNDREMVLSDKVGLPVKYGGSDARLREPLPVPDAVYGAMVYLIQNATLATKKQDTTVNKKGDVTYYTTASFYTHLGNIRDNAVDIASKVATPTQEDIHELLKYLGMDQAFRDIQFGGSFNDMRVAIRIPTSRSNQLKLEGLLSQTEVFNDIFKVKTFTHNYIDIKDSEKKEDLLDPYSTSKLEYPEIDDSVNGYYGCRSGDTYRYWYVSEEWLKSLTTEQLTIVFWMGLDIVTEQGNPCPFDKILAIIIVVVLTYFTAGLGTGTALTVAQGLSVASGILSIASITGVIDAKTAGILGAVLAVATLGNSVIGSVAASSTAIMNQAITVASQVLSTVQTFEQEAFTEEVEDLKKQIEDLTEDAELWETNFRFTYSDSFNMGVRNGPEADPYKYLKDTYKPYTIYTTPGFQ